MTVESTKQIAEALNTPETKKAMAALVTRQAAMAAGKLSGPVGMVVGVAAPIVITAILDNYINPEVKTEGTTDEEIV